MKVLGVGQTAYFGYKLQGAVELYYQNTKVLARLDVRTKFHESFGMLWPPNMWFIGKKNDHNYD